MLPPEGGRELSLDGETASVLVARFGEGCCEAEDGDAGHAGGGIALLASDEPAVMCEW